LKWGGELIEAVGHFRQAVRLEPDAPSGLTSLAWMLATAAEETVRDPSQAVRLAERAVELTGRREVEAMDVLAAAYATAGLFDRALDTAEEAIRLDPAGPLAAAILERQQLYTRREPYREPVVSLPARPPLLVR
jgi:tetratricopeptide (TPR) repeat protein